MREKAKFIGGSMGGKTIEVDVFSRVVVFPIVDPSIPRIIEENPEWKPIMFREEIYDRVGHDTFVLREK